MEYDIEDGPGGMPQIEKERLWKVYHTQEPGEDTTDTERPGVE